MIGSARISGVILAMLPLNISSAALATEFQTTPPSVLDLKADPPVLNLNLDPTKLQHFDPLAVTPLKPPAAVQPVQKASKDEEGAHFAPMLNDATTDTGQGRGSDDFLVRHAFGIQLKSNF